MQILIINGHQRWPVAKGALNAALADAAREVCAAAGHEVRATAVDGRYEAAAEVDGFLWADRVLWQFPVYWFGPPWKMKKYIDEVFMMGYGRIWRDDGRTRDDPSRKYGSGGLLQGRRYMLSTTWNAPAEAFGDPAQIFAGGDVDDAMRPLHRALEFCGMEALPSFAVHDVMKAPPGPGVLDAFRSHIARHLAA